MQHLADEAVGAGAERGGRLQAEKSQQMLDLLPDPLADGGQDEFVPAKRVERDGSEKTGCSVRARMEIGSVQSGSRENGPAPRARRAARRSGRSRPMRGGQQVLVRPC